MEIKNGRVRASADLQEGYGYKATYMSFPPDGSTTRRESFFEEGLRPSRNDRELIKELRDLHKNYMNSFSRR
jgi:hypothetical protein